MRNRSGLVLLMTLLFGFTLLLLFSSMVQGAISLARLERSHLLSLESYYLSESGVTYATHLGKNYPSQWAALPSFPLPSSLNTDAVKVALLALPTPSFFYPMGGGAFQIIKKQGENRFYTVGFGGDSPKGVSGRTFFSVTYKTQPSFQILTREML